MLLMSLQIQAFFTRVLRYSEHPDKASFAFRHLPFTTYKSNLLTFRLLDGLGEGRTLKKESSLPWVDPWRAFVSFFIPERILSSLKIKYAFQNYSCKKSLTSEILFPERHAKMIGSSKKCYHCLSTICMSLQVL